MTKTALDALVRHRLKVSKASEPDQDVIDSVRAEVLQDIAHRYAWSFLIRKDDSQTLTAAQYQKTFPADFAKLVSVELKDSNNVIYPVHSVKWTEYAEDNPDLDDATQRPWRYWLYYDHTGGKPEQKIEFRCKSDATYTIIFWYIKELRDDDITTVPNGLVIFYGIMAALAKPEEMSLYKNLYEASVLKMYENDRPDLQDETVFEVDPAIEAYEIHANSIR